MAPQRHFHLRDFEQKLILATEPIRLPSNSAMAPKMKDQFATAAANRVSAIFRIEIYFLNSDYARLASSFLTELTKVRTRSTSTGFSRIP